MTSPLVSVIITTYRRSQLLERAVESVMRQTYHNLEIIVVDDNSQFPIERESSRKCQKKFKKIKLIENPTNLGGSLSRNVGIEQATGELISFLDDDDEYLSDRIEKMVKLYIKKKDSNIGLIYCNCYAVDTSGKIIGGYDNNLNGNPLYEQMLNCIAATSMWLAPKDVLKKVGMFELATNKQDSILLLKILVNGYNIFSVNERLVLYHLHDGSGISGTKATNIKGWLLYREWCRKYYDKITKKQVKKVESNFSYNLITLYVINNMMQKAKEELRIMFKNNFFSKLTFKSILKCFFSKLYLIRLNRINQ